MSLSYYTPDAQSVERIRRRELAASYRAQAAPTEDFAARLAAFQAAYPNMNAGVMVSLAKAGLDPASAEVQQIADASFERDRKAGMFDRIGDVLDTTLGSIDETIAPIAKGAVRTGFVVLETTFQEVQTFIRNAGWAGVRVHDKTGASTPLERLSNLVNPAKWDDWARELGDAYGELNAGGSSGREALSKWAAGEEVDLGTGILPGGQITEDVRSRAGRLTLKVGDAQFGGPGNPSITTGRAVAASVTEPGTQPYNVLSGMVDGGVAWFGDPASAIGGLAHTGQAARRVGRAGRAVREGRGVAGAAEELATAPGFYQVVDRSAQSRAAERLGDVVDAVTGRVTSTRNTVNPNMVDGWLTKGGRHVVNKIAETSDFYDLWNATGRKMGVDLTRRLADAGSEQEVMDILRPALGVGLRDAPEFNGFKVRKANKPGIRLLAGMPGSHIDPTDIDDGAEQLDRWLRNAKVTPELRRSAMDRFVRTTDRPAIVTTLSEIMEDVAGELATTIKGRDGMQAAARAREMTKMWGQTHDAARAYFVDEIAENRRSAGVVVNGQRLETASPFLFTEYLNGVIPLHDPRELRRATSRIARLVDNPVFEKSTGAIDGVQGVWKRMVLLRGAYTVRVIGEEQVRMAASGLDSMFAHPISFISSLVGNGKAAERFTVGRHRVGDVLGGALTDSDEFMRAQNTGWAGWVDDAVYDRHFTLFKPEEEGYQRAWAQSIGELRNDPIARRVADAQGNLADVKEWFWAQQGRGLRKRLVTDRPALATRDGSDAYIDTLWEGVQARTGSDPVLLEAIATGRLAGAPIGQLNDRGRWNLSSELLAHLDDVVGPPVVKGQKLAKTGAAGGMGEVWDNATGWAFSWLNTKPTNYLSRSGTFRQTYWQRLEEMLPHMDDATRTKALKAAEGAVTDDQLARMRKVVGQADPSITDLADADTVAKGFALDQTKNLLYDLTQKSQFFDAFRLIFPFGEAWREVLTRWARIGLDNPRVPRRGQQIITGARGNGFFHKDVNGEEVFTYPFSRQLSKMAIGMPVDLTGRVAGLSLMTEVLPGVGPVIQVPAAAILPDTPNWDFARRFISPYGEPDYSEGILESFLPGYARNIRQFFEAGDERLFANTVGATMDYLTSTGEYNLASPDEMRRLKDDATSLARNVYLMRGLVQFGAPSAPQPQTLVEDKDGNLDVARVVLQDFYDMQEKDYESAVGEFLDRYGPDVFLMTQGKSFAIAETLPVTKTSADWERSNGDIVKDFPQVWGFFAPKGDTDSFDYQAYARQFSRGDRVTLTPEQRVTLAQARVGRHIYTIAESKLSEKPTASEREWLAAVKERIRLEYPGFGEQVPGLPARASTGQVVAELGQAITDPRLAGSRLAQAARLYLAARDQALVYANETGVKTLEAQAAEPARTWLGKVGQAIVDRYPEFAEMFDVTFSREVEA